MANLSYVTSFVLKYKPFNTGNDSFIKIDSYSWRGVGIDTWHVKGDRDYQQMVGYFITPDGREVTLGRRDTAVMGVDSSEFRNARQQFFIDLIQWSFHGFVDHLDYALTAADLVVARDVIDQFPPHDGTYHSTLTLADAIELYGKEVRWLVTSRKLTRGKFEQTVDFFVDGDAPDTERHFIINPPDVEHPFLKVGDWFEQHKSTIIDTLGLDKEK